MLLYDPATPEATLWRAHGKFIRHDAQTDTVTSNWFRKRYSRPDSQIFTGCESRAFYPATFDSPTQSRAINERMGLFYFAINRRFRTGLSFTFIRIRKYAVYVKSIGRSFRKERNLKKSWRDWSRLFAGLNGIGNLITRNSVISRARSLINGTRR